MALPWLTIWEVTLTVAVLWSTAFTLFIVTLPSRYQSVHPEIREDLFTEDDISDPDRSGYGYFLRNREANGSAKTKTSVQIIVLGDIGRSPRMQYHALSIARNGGVVDIIGYLESDPHPDLVASRLINIVPIPPFPKLLQSNSKLLFVFLAPLKVLWQIFALYRALAYLTPPSKWMLVQNPPSIPTLAVAQLICLFRNTRLVIDWHNFGYSILSLRLGPSHPLVRISEWYEGYFGRGATAHFCVTDAMARVLKEKWNISALSLHDRPPQHFQPLSADKRNVFLHRLGETKDRADAIEKGTCRLIVSSTSWTPDEDFSVLLEALTQYSTAVSKSRSQLPEILAIITGKGPQKTFYTSKIQELQQAGKLPHAHITTAWLSAADYATLLGSADLGISLHTSSSGVDLPMKVVDMFGTGLPVAGWSKFEAWKELVQEGVNGRGFESAEGLNTVLQELFANQGRTLQELRKGAMKECERRWDDEWMPVAGKLFQLE